MNLERTLVFMVGFSAWIETVFFTPGVQLFTGFAAGTLIGLALFKMKP